MVSDPAGELQGKHNHQPNAYAMHEVGSTVQGQPQAQMAGCIIVVKRDQ
jgi:hypothetical protein